MRAQSSDRALLKRREWGRVVASSAGLERAVELPRSLRVRQARSNPLACDHARSANSITGRISVAIGVKRPSKGKSSHDAFHNPACQRANIKRHHSWGAAAPAGGGRAASVSQAELDLRGRPHTTLAVRQGRSAHPLHEATAGGVGGREHPLVKANASGPGRRYGREAGL